MKPSRLAFLLVVVLCFGAAPPLLGQFTTGQGNVTLLGQVEMPGERTADVWGYVDAATGTPYALLGISEGLTVVDVLDPLRPFRVADVQDVPFFDIKTWRQYAYTVTGGSSGEGRIIDLSDPRNPLVVGSFPSAHNIFIDARGYLYAEVQGLKIYDLNPDPTQPRLIWSGGVEGHDATVVGDRLYDFHGRAGTFIYDVADPADPRLLGSILDPGIRYHHSGWPTADGRYLFICDELASHPSPDVTVWDISDPLSPQRVATIADAEAVVHNLYIIGRYAYVAYYSAGFKVYDVADPTNPTLVGAFDTPSPPGEVLGAGAWGAFPFTPSGDVYVSNFDLDPTTRARTSSLYVFSVPIDDETPEEPVEETALFQSYPNPFAASTTIRYELPERAQVTLKIYDALGREVTTLVEGERPAGRYAATWHAEGVAGGLYLSWLEVDGRVRTQRLVVLR